MARLAGLAGLVLLVASPARGQALAVLVRPEQVSSAAVGWFAPQPSGAELPSVATDNPHLALAASGRAEDACRHCHPSSQGIGETTLWGQGGGVWIPYASATTDLPAAPGPGPQTTLCLSCHDGISGSSHGAVARAAGSAQGSGTLLDWLSNLGAERAPARDPNAEHPVAIRYLDGLDDELHPRARVEAAGLPFYGPMKDQLECTTCHDPHRNTSGSYLRLSNERSRLCLSCHDK